MTIMGRERVQDLAKLEKEIRQTCGDEFMEELVKEAARDRRGRFAMMGCTGFLFLILVGIIGVYPTIPAARYAIRYWRTSGGVQTVAEVTRINPEYPEVVDFRFEVDGKRYVGRSPLLPEAAAECRVGDSVAILHIPGNPSTNRAVDAEGAFSRSRYTLVGWGLLAFLSFFAGPGMWRTFRRKAPDIRWLAYATTTPEPSPRAWLQDAIRSGRTENGGATALFSASSLDPWDLLAEQSEALREWEWFRKKARSLDVPSALLHAKYAERWFHELDEPLPVAAVGIPASLDALADEIDVFPFVFLLAQLANNGSAEQPEVDLVELDLAGLDAARVIAHYAGEAEKEDAISDELFFDKEGARKAIDKTRTEADWGAASFAVTRSLARTGAIAGTENVQGADALLLVRGLLYWFFGTPWRTAAFDRELPMRREDGGTVLLRLQFEPGTFLRLTRRHDPALDNGGLPAGSDALPTGVHRTNIDGAPCMRIRHPERERTDAPLRSLATAPSRAPATTVPVIAFACRIAARC